MSGSEQENHARNGAKNADLEARSQRIRDLNDEFRRHPHGGLVTVTPGIQDLGVAACAVILAAVQTLGEFTTDNDPYGEHDFGALTIEHQKVFWKIDYYDKQLKYGSPDPANPAVTSRVLTIMLASEY